MVFNLYYEAFIDIAITQAVMSFDVRSEKIDLIKGPELPDYNMFMSQKFTSYEGKLAILLTGNGDCSFYMWILEDAAKHEWSKKAYVVPDFFPLDPFVLLMQVRLFCYAIGGIQRQLGFSIIIQRKTQ